MANSPESREPHRVESAEYVAWLFYDGGCGLCHVAVRFVLPRDRRGCFRYAPLNGETFRRILSDAQRSGLPDSLVLVPCDGSMLVRSSAVVRILRELGGAWGVIGWVIGLVPRGLRDAGYEAVASVRGRLFTKPDQACPMVPPRWRDRFAD